MSPILFYFLCSLAALIAVLACLPQGRRLLAHCYRVLMNGKTPLRWLAGLLAGVLPPVCWTMAFKLARNIPPEWRPAIHTHFLPLMELAILSPSGVALLTLLASPFAILLRMRARTPESRNLYPCLILLFPTWLKVLNTIALSTPWTDAQDVLAWVFYGVLHFASPFLAGWWIWGFGSPGAAVVFGITLGAQNLSGLISHIMFPTAAPWFYDEHPDWETLLIDYSFPGSSAGLVRVDKVLGTHLYQAAFKKSPVVFGALPSLHAATATCFSLFVSRYGGRWGHGIMILYSSIMFWSTQYLHHHWAADLLLGSLLSVAAFSIALIPLRKLDAHHQNHATTRGVDRLFCRPSPHQWRYETLPMHDSVQVRQDNAAPGQQQQRSYDIEAVAEKSSPSSKTSSQDAYRHVQYFLPESDDDHSEDGKSSMLGHSYGGSDSSSLPPYSGPSSSSSSAASLVRSGSPNRSGKRSD